MAYSVNTPVGDGVTKQFAVNFTNGLYSRDSVYVFVDGEVDGLGNPIERSFTWINDGRIELDGDAPGSGVTVEIRRVMDKDTPGVDFEDGEILTEATANRGLDHLLNTIHELLDGYFPGGVAGREFAEFLKGMRVRGDLEVTGEITAGEADPDNPDGVVTFGSGDSRFVNKSGDTMTGALNIPPATSPTHAARKDQLTSEKNQRVDADAVLQQEIDLESYNRQAADANIQQQLTGNIPLESSAFSPISWHDQTIESSVVIPDNKNAWSFGPVISIDPGQSVTVGEGAFWTIANGEQQ